MSDFTFIHAADLHLDSPLRGLERYEGAPVEEIRNATRRAFTNLVDLAIEEEVKFVIIAGDVYDGDWKDYNTGLFFVRQMSRLREAGIAVYMVAGNHDAASVLTKQLALPENVRRFSSRSPESHLIEDLGVVLHGQSFVSRAVPENLSSGYPAALDGYLNIGVLHTSATGRDGHDVYAPCSVDDLAAKGYDYWALGHVHHREVLSDFPWVVFPGNIQGRHIRERGAKGCTLVSVVDRDIVSVEPRELDVLRWIQAEITCAEAQCLADVTEQVVEVLRQEVERHDGRTLATRVVLSGASRAHVELSGRRDHVVAEIRAAALDHFGEGVWIEKVVVATSASSDWADDLQDGTAASDLLRLIEEVSADDASIAALAGEFDVLKKKLPADLVAADPEQGEFSPQWFRNRLAEVRQEILPLLLSDPK